ncbi:HAD hydrolase-like protein [Pleurocapsa sp. FMAR1]|uniref:HAD hydrolase-like protein n=1 Tax=Pleurocapsa sp. FMAR1 TaxID=3040204 RepID=UPI0029C7DB1F|nr:HAD hydrolase-like protein [Pleurocapsa sp. FMAR1]
MQLDIGAFVAGLEYASGKTATVVGKPSDSFFQLALAELELPAENVVMVRAKKAGLTGILVKTGKYRQELVERSDVEPDLVLESVTDIKQILD